MKKFQTALSIHAFRGACVRKVHNYKNIHPSSTPQTGTGGKANTLSEQKQFSLSCLYQIVLLSKLVFFLARNMTLETRDSNQKPKTA